MQTRYAAPVVDPAQPSLWTEAWRQIDAGVVITDLDGRIIGWNDGATRLFGWSADEAVGQGWDELAGPVAADPDPRRAEIYDRLRAGDGYTGELTVQVKAGHRIPILVTGGRIRDDGGSVVGSIGIAIDDSRRTHAEERFEVAFRASPVASVITSGERQLILDVNPAFEQLTGIARRHAIGRTSNELGLWEDPVVSEAILELTRRAASITDQRIRFRIATGAIAHARLSGRPITLSDGPAYLWMAVDETDQVDTEERLRSATARLAAVVEASPLAIVLVDTEQRVQLWNPAAERLVGWAADEVLGTLNPIRSRDPEETERIAAAVDASGEPVSAVVTIVDRLGRDVRVELALAPVRDAQGTTVGLLAIGADISERERISERLQLAQRMEAIGVLAGGIAHDINNTMTAIGGNAALAGLAIGPTHPAADDLAEIVRATERAAALTRQLLAFSRRAVLRPETLDLTAATEEMAPMLRRLLGPDVTMEVRASGVAPVRADPGQIQQVLLNLVVNARDAMPGGGALTIGIEGPARSDPARPAAAPAMVRLTVADTGTGMDEHVRSRLFEPFFTTKPAGKGTGLGLAVVHGIVEQSGGRIDVESRPGAGTTFRIALPAADASDAHAPTPRPPAGAVSAATILLVEDEPSIRALARRVLEGRGHRVVEAADGVEALDRLALIGAVDLVLTDLTMPRMGGEELATRLGETRPALPVVFMSGYGESRLARDGVLDPSIRLLSKPFAIDDLTEMVEGALDRAS